MDGVDHINVYSKGATLLGQQLSNFAHTQFMYSGYPFASVEAWWYWMKLGRRKDDAYLRTLYGVAAKNHGRSVAAPGAVDPTRTRLKEVYKLKLQYNPALEQAVRASTLPFDHYYVYNGVRRDTQHRWTGQLWNEVRNELKEKPMK